MRVAMRATRGHCFAACALGIVVLAACGGGAANAPPTFVFLSPVTDVTSFRGGRVPIRYVATDAEGVARTTLVADRDGDLATEHDQFVIAAERPASGTAASESWATMGVPAGAYRIVGTTTDAAGATVTAIATALVVVVDPPPPDRHGGPDEDLFPRVATLADGSAIVTAFGGVGPIEFEDTALGRPASHTMLLVRHDRTGAVVWAREVVEPPMPEASVAAFVRDVATFADGSCVVVGLTYGTATFGVGEPAETTLNERGPFVARFEASGELRWVRAATDDTPGLTGTLYRVGTAADGSCIVAGSFVQRLTFGSTEVVSAGSNDVFVARYDAQGRLLWVRRDGGPGHDLAADIAVESDGSCVVVGSTALGSTFGAGESEESVVTGPPGSDVAGREPFICRYAPDGTLVWLRTITGVGDDAAVGVSLFANGDCVVAGTVFDRATLGSGDGHATLDPVTSAGPYVARITRAGAPVWARVVPLQNRGEGRSVIARNDGSCVAVCYEMVARGPPGLLIEFDENGTQGAVRVLGTGSQLSSACDAARFADDSLVVTGFFREAIAIPPGTLAPALTSAGRTDVFVAWIPRDG